MATLRIRLRSAVSTKAAATPTATPPPAARTKPPAISAAETVPAIAAMAARRQTSAVASLTSDSPSRMVTTRRGMPTFRAIAVAATASGGATTAPRAMAAASGISGNSQATTSPTLTVPKMT